MAAEVVDLQQAASDHPIVVHEPVDWRKLFKAFAKHGPRATYRTRCGLDLEIPPDVRPRRQPEGGYYFSCGPNPRYFVGCKACDSGLGAA